MKTKNYIYGLVLGLMIFGIFVFSGGFTGYISGQRPAEMPNAPFTEKIEQENAETQVGVSEGMLAPDFSLKTIEGKTVKLSDFRGKYVVISFMATWCTPCQIEASNIRNVQEKTEKEIVVMQIGVDTREDPRKLEEFRKGFGKPDWIMGLDRTLKTANLYNVKSFDTTIITDPEGRIIYRDDGWPIDEKTLKDILG